MAIYKYDAWGNVSVNNLTNDNLGDLNPFRYRGYYFDSETGYYYLNSRYYDSNVGRFINADETSNLGVNNDVQSLNLYTYCANNPINKLDVCGDSWISSLFINLAINVSHFMIEVAISQEPPTLYDILGVLAYSIAGTFEEKIENILAIVNGGIALVVSLLNGASLGEAICNGLIAAAMTITTFGFANKYIGFTKDDKDMALVIADTIFDYSKTTIVSAISRAISSKAESNSNKKSESIGFKGTNSKRTFSMLPGAKNMLDRYSYDYWRWC